MAISYSLCTSKNVFTVLALKPSFSTLLTTASNTSCIQLSAALWIPYWLSCLSLWVWPLVLFKHFITTGLGRNYRWIEQKYINCISPGNFPSRILMLLLFCVLCEILQYAHKVLSTVAKQLCILFHKWSLCIRSVRKTSNHSSACFPYSSTASLFITSHSPIPPHLHFTQVNPRAPSKPLWGSGPKSCHDWDFISPCWVTGV